MKRRYYVPTVRLKTTVQYGHVVVITDDPKKVLDLARKAIDNKQVVFESNVSDRYSSWMVANTDKITSEEET